MLADPQSSHQTQSSEASNGSLKNESSIAVTTSYNQLHAEQQPSTMANDLSKIYASILSATTSSNNGSASPVIVDASSLNIFQVSFW